MNLKIVVCLLVIVACFAPASVAKEDIADPASHNQKKRPLLKFTDLGRKRPANLAIQTSAFSIETTGLPGGSPTVPQKPTHLINPPCLLGGSPIPVINKVTCVPAGSPTVPPKRTLSINTACFPGNSLIFREKIEIHRIYDKYPTHALIVTARELVIPMLSASEDTTLDDLSNSILPFLNQLELLRVESSAATVTRTRGTGAHNSGIYLVSQGGQSIFVVKIHHRFRTHSETYWSLHGVATWNRSQEVKYKSYPHLPKLCCDMAIGAFKLSENQYHLSVMHAAQGESVSDILKRKDRESDENKIKILAALGKSLGCFHAYHALHNDSLQKRFEDYMKIKGESFYTVNHMDLHPGNIFVDDLENVTFVDLEGMFSAIISPRENLVDWDKLQQYVCDLFGEGSLQLKALGQGYQQCLSETWEIYKRLNPLTIVSGPSTIESDG